MTRSDLPQGILSKDITETTTPAADFPSKHYLTHPFFMCTVFSGGLLSNQT